MSSDNSNMISDGEVERESSVDEMDHMMEEEDDESSTEDNTPLQYNYEYIPDKHTVSNDENNVREYKRLKRQQQIYRGYYNSMVRHL